MGISFSFTAKPATLNKCFVPSWENPATATELLITHMEKIMASYGCTGEILVGDGCFRVHFCPQGFMTLRFRGNTLKGNAKQIWLAPASMLLRLILWTN